MAVDEHCLCRRPYDDTDRHLAVTGAARIYNRVWIAAVLAGR
jgi:hypothetical protein